MFIVFDLDGTLALTEHRAHFLNQEPKDWRGFYAACDRDKPCSPLIQTAMTYVCDGHRVEIWSGRSDEVAAKTEAWLTEHGLGGLPLRMRPASDHQPDTKLKAAWLDRCGDRRPDLVFEDRTSMVAMWRSHGIVCAQVAPGDF
jgi:hypothetical protein